MAHNKAASSAHISSGAAESETKPSTGLVCVDAQAVLRLTTGRRRVPLEELGPAPFNRFAQALSGRHVLGLAESILKKWGFATYKYEAGWCHEAPRAADASLPPTSP